MRFSFLFLLLRLLIGGLDVVVHSLKVVVETDSVDSIDEIDDDDDGLVGCITVVTTRRICVVVVVVSPVDVDLVDVVEPSLGLDWRRCASFCRTCWNVGKMLGARPAERKAAQWSG